MKAVLEFTYPQDETKLKHALRGEEYYLALIEIDRVFNIGGHPEQMLLPLKLTQDRIDLGLKILTNQRAILDLFNVSSEHR
jgi:hypothetical protein